MKAVIFNVHAIPVVVKNIKTRGSFIVASLLLMLGHSSTLQAAPVTEGTTALHTHPYVMDVGAGIMVGGGDALPGATVTLKTRINADIRLYAGGELGVFFFSGGGSTGAILPILGNLTAEFDATPRVHPVIGVSAGPTIATGGGYSVARFSFLLNPGIHFDLNSTSALSFLARFGAVGSAFVVIPQVGLLFTI